MSHFNGRPFLFGSARRHLGTNEEIMKKKKKLVWWVVLLILAFAIAGGIWVWMADEPPVAEMENNRKALSEAEKMSAEIYCHSLYSEAKAKYNLAMTLWKRENERFILLRRFDSVRMLTLQSMEMARGAEKKAKEVQGNMRTEVQEEIAGLRQEMKDFEKVFMALPLGQRIVSQHSRGKLLLNEAEIAFEKGDYNAGRVKSKEAAGLIRASYQSGKQLLNDYYKNLPRWQEELKKAIEYSERNKDYVIVVHKIPALCEIYYRGKKKYSFPAEFGKNWIGDKCREGDYATPEGEYRVIKRLQGSMTRYYKALLLDYPNAADRVRIDKMKKNGSLPKNARPGSLIEIHGDGGRGANWTNGCVALANEDMSVVYRYADKGTLVVIIGAAEEM